jgi:hypothetical protein
MESGPRRRCGNLTTVWGGRTTQTGSPYTVANDAWNSNRAPNATTTLGFIAPVWGTPTVTVSCTPA